MNALNSLGFYELFDMGRPLWWLCVLIFLGLIGFYVWYKKRQK